MREGFRVIQPDVYTDEGLEASTRQLPLTIVVNPDGRLALHNQEVFGPILSVYTYRTLDEAIAIVNAKQKRLALYIFGKNKRDIRRVCTQTSAEA